MSRREKEIVERAFEAWRNEDLDLLRGCLHRSAISLIHMPRDAWPMFGPLIGRIAVLAGLKQVSDNFHVVDYRPLRMRPEEREGGTAYVCSTVIKYAHRRTGHLYETTTRAVWTVRGDSILKYEVFHDAEKLRAFYEMVKGAEH
jgi:ketosteroid isomerase-like protein